MRLGGVTAVRIAWFTCLSGCGPGGRSGELPSGTVTFLFTDLEGSTRLWEEHPDAMQSASVVTTKSCVSQSSHMLVRS